MFKLTVYCRFQYLNSNNFCNMFNQQMLNKKEIQQYRNQQQVIQAFRQYFQEFKLYFSSLDQLHDGKILAQFLSNIQNFPLKHSDLIQQTTQIYGASVTNLKSVVSSIVKFQKENLKNKNFMLNFDFFRIYNKDFKYQSEMMNCLLSQSLRVAIQGQNSEFFIRKVMSLSQRSQTIFLNLIKKFIRSISSTPNTTPESTPLVTPKLNKQNLRLSRSQVKSVEQSNQKQNSPFSQQKLNSGQKIKKRDQKQLLEYYEYELNKVIAQNQGLVQTVQNYENQIRILRNQNCSLNALIAQLQEKILSVSKEHSSDQQTFIESMNQKISSISQENQDMIQLHHKQKDNLKNLYQQKLEQLNELLKTRQDAYQQSKTQIERLLRKIHELCYKIQIQQKEIRNINSDKKKILVKNNQLQQQNIKIANQLEKSRCKLQELTLIISFKNTEKEDSEKLNKFGSPLRNQMEFYQKYQKINDAKDGQIEMLQTLQIYKRKISQQNKQISVLNKNKLRIKALQNEKNKLLGLIKQYQQYRGEENQILMGCILQFSSSFCKPMKDITVSAKNKLNNSVQLNQKND